VQTNATMGIKSLAGLCAASRAASPRAASPRPPPPARRAPRRLPAPPPPARRAPRRLPAPPRERPPTAAAPAPGYISVCVVMVPLVDNLVHRIIFRLHCCYEIHHTLNGIGRRGRCVNCQHLVRHVLPVVAAPLPAARVAAVRRGHPRPPKWAAVRGPRAAPDAHLRFEAVLAQHARHQRNRTRMCAHLPRPFRHRLASICIQLECG
jgi:hypothetical protein